MFRNTLAVLVALLVLASAGAPAAAALSGSQPGATATTTDVVLQGPSDPVGVGETVTYTVVLASADGGVASFDNITVSTNDSSVAEVTGVTASNAFVGANTGVTDDGTGYVNVPFGGDTNDTGEVALATVTVETNGAGTVALDLNITGDIADESGAVYTVGAVEDATLTVEDQPPETEVVLRNASATAAPGETVSYDVVLTSAEGGVGAFNNVTVTVNDTDVATVTDVSTPFGVGETFLSADGTSAAARVAFGGDSANTGEVVLATVTLTANASGTAALELNVTGDVATEGGEVYNVTGAGDATLTVESAGGDDGTEVPEGRTLNATPRVQNTTVGGTVTFEVVLENATNGVGAFGNITITAGNASVAAVTRVTASDAFPSSNAGVTDDGTGYVNVPFGGDTATGDVVLATVTVQATAPGTTTVELTVGEISDESGSLYDVAGTVDGQVNVASGPPDLTGNGQAPTSTDGDPQLEDINGNGMFDIGDIQALYSNRNSETLRSFASQFDFNGNGIVDIGDVQALFSEFRSS